MYSKGGDNMKLYRYFEPLFFEDDYENFKSNVCHFLKQLQDRDFLFISLSEKWVSILFTAKMYDKAYYVLALTDYLSEKHGLKPFSDYDTYRTGKLPEPLFPKDVLLTDLVSDKDIKADTLDRVKTSPIGKYFLRYNIVEDDIYNVY